MKNVRVGIKAKLKVGKERRKEEATTPKFGNMTVTVNFSNR